VNKCSSCIFISKTSESRLQFSRMGSKAGDIYYYGHASKEAGFSVPVEMQFSYAPLFEVYARLRDHTPVIRIEIMGRTSEKEVKSILNKLRHHSVAGYPYCLKLAHNTCKISNEDVDRLASIFGLQNEQGARDALNE
jgi:NurA-like 5'-3' nuclease